MMHYQTYNDLGEFILREDGIIHIIPNEKNVNVKMAERVVKIIHSLMDGNPRGLLVDNRNLSSIERPARKIFAKEVNNQFTVAVAMIVKSPLNKIVVNFFLRLNNLSRPTKIFNSEVEAINWLKKHL